MDIQRFDASTIGALDWPATPDGDYARRCLLPFMEAGPLTYIANAHAELQVLKLGETLLPITLSDFHPANSYVCSPYTHYVSYAKEEFRRPEEPAGGGAAAAAVCAHRLVSAAEPSSTGWCT